MALRAAIDAGRYMNHSCTVFVAYVMNQLNFASSLTKLITLCADLCGENNRIHLGQTKSSIFSVTGIRRSGEHEGCKSFNECAQDERRRASGSRLRGKRPPANHLHRKKLRT